MFSFFQSDKPPYAVEKISNGKFLDKAKEVNVGFFFQHWMQKKPRKALVGCWFILYEDEEYVYWGWPQFKRLFSDKRVAVEFYKTNKAALNQAFPNYKSIYGNVIRLKLQEVIQKSHPEKVYASVSLGFKAQLLDATIIIETNCTLKPHTTADNPNPEAEKASYKIVLDKNTLDLVELERINK